MSNEYHNGEDSPGGWPHAPGNAVPATTPASDGIDLTQLIQSLRQRLLFILSCGFALFVLVMGYTAFSPMGFQATGRLYLGELGNDRPEGPGVDLTGGGAQSDIGSEVEILRSDSIVRRAAVKAGANVDISPPGWDPPKYWKWRLDGRDPTSLDVASRKLLATDTTLDDNVRDTQSYSVVFKSEMKYELRDGGGSLLGKGSLGVPLKAPGLTLTLQPGAKEAPKAGDEFDVTVFPLHEVADWILGDLEVTAPTPTGGEPPKVVSLTYTSWSPRQAATFLRNLMTVYLDIKQSWKTENAEAAEKFVKKQLQGMQKSLDETQQKLADYRSDNPVVVLESEADSMVQQLARYEEERVRAKLLVSHLSDVKRALKEDNPPIEAFMFGEADDAVLRGMADSLSQAQRRLVELRGMFKEAAPDVRQQRVQVKAQLGMIRNYVDSRHARASEQLKQLNGVIGSYRSRLRSVPGAEAGLAQIGRESEVYSKMYAYLLEQHQQTAMAKASTISKNRILDFPQVPLYEDSPRLGLRIASGLLGLLLGAFLVIARTLLSTALRSDTEARTVVGKVPVFSSVPLQEPPRTGDGPPPPPIFDVLARGLENFAFAEAYRTLRTNLYYALREGHGKVLLFTSVVPADGKTTSALSLAAMLAADAKRVLVIDCDLRKPSHHELTGQTLRPGLNGMLTGQHTWREATRQVHLSLGHFDSISAGVGANVELLSSGALSKFLIDARSRYDFIIVDCPPYPLVSDALILAHLADFVLSVVRLSHTPRRMAEEHFRGLLGFAHRHGVVINNSEAANVQRYPYPERPPRFMDDLSPEKTIQ
ncbi:MAG: AAA family ATPase [Myxococcales bacterium]|nr:AAA family ATPase [Myxococcales bacterium]